MEIAARQYSGIFDFGIFNWNMFIFTTIPAQLFGYKFKESLLINFEGDPTYKLYRYTSPKGATYTGMTDAFRSFWLFGSIKFFIISLLLGSIFRKADKGYVGYQMLYSIMLPASLLTITHSTQWFITTFFHLSVFLLPGLYFAHIKNKSHK